MTGQYTGVCGSETAATRQPLAGATLKLIDIDQPENSDGNGNRADIEPVAR